MKTKNRDAQELLNRREKVIARMSDPEESLTTEQVTSLTEEANSLQERAAFLADLHATTVEDAEERGAIEKQAPEQVERAEESETNFGKFMERSAEQIQKYFYGPADYIKRARCGRFANDKQRDTFQNIQRQYGRFLLHNVKPGDDEEVTEIRKMVERTITGASGSAEALLPLEQVASIFTVDNMIPGIMATAQRYPVSGRTLRIPFVDQSTNDGGETRPLSGIAAVTIIGEGVTKPVRDVKFDQRLLTVFKWAAFSAVGDETFADDFTGDLAPTMTQMVGGEVLNAQNDAFSFSGAGTTAPIGAFHANNPARIIAGGGAGGVLRETASTVTVNDIFDMYSKHLMGPASRWYVSRSVLPKLLSLTLSGNTLVTWLPDLRGAPGYQLLGIPVVVTDFAPPVGTATDVSLGNGAYYACAVRQQLTVESSIHFQFQDDLTSYRFLSRAGGIPLPNGPYSYKSDGSDTQEAPFSPFVILGPDS